MKVSRRDAIRISGTTVAGTTLARLSIDTVIPEQALAQAAPQEWPDQLVDMDVRERAELPLNPDGSAGEYPPEQAGEISSTIWRYTGGEPPDIEFDYRQMAVKVDPRGVASRGGTLRFSDLEPLPRHSQVTLLQCGAPDPSGIVKWTGVRFSEFAELIGVEPTGHYCRVIGADGHWADEDIRTMLHPQVMLAWLLNDEPIPPKHGAPLRLVIPFRYGNRNIKSIAEIIFGSTSLPFREQPARRG